MRPEMVDRAVAERVAKIFARAEQHALNQARRRNGQRFITVSRRISLAGAGNYETMTWKLG
jgi:hypothetical protein